MRENKKVRKAKSTILFVLVLALLAQLMSVRLAHGADNKVAEKFVAGKNAASGTAVELRAEATIVGAEIRFRQIARWSDSDKATLDPVGELIIGRFRNDERFKTIGISELRGLFSNAGVNIATLNFVGPTTCTITRSDQPLEQGKAIEQLNQVAANGVVSHVQFANPTTAPVSGAAVPQAGVKSLANILTENLATKLNIAVDSLQVDFRPQDEGLLRLTDAQCKFAVEPQRAGALGEVSWYVKVTTNGNTTRSFVGASARAWQDQLVIARPLASKQAITDTDVIERRILVDRLSDDTMMKREQVVNQVASRDLKAGTVVTAKMVDSAPLVRPGQFVTIENIAGAIKIRVVARALDGGCYGQSIRVMNETTREVSRVTVTGPQQASLGSV